MEQNTEAGTPMTPVENDKKSGNGLKIATAIACVVAACGIGFGVYGMIQSSQKDSQISDLKVQIKEGDGTITTIETPEVETTTNNGTTVTITDTTKVSGGPYIENGYFYVPEWGVKYKLSDDLANYAFSVTGDNESLAIGMSAISKGDSGYNSPYDLMSPMVLLSATTKEKWESSRSSYGLTVIEKEDHDYVYFLSNCLNDKCRILTDETSTIINMLNAIFSNPEKI